METIPTIIPTSLKVLIESIIQQEQEQEQDIRPKRLKELVIAANVQAKDLEQYADFEHKPTEGYGRKTVFQTATFEVMVMSWVPGDFSAIHNHGYTDWGAVQVFGKAQHNIYNYKAPHLSIAKQESLLSGEVVKVNNALIHQMGNASTKPYLSLHVYGCQKAVGDITADSKIYELEKNRIVETTGGAFFELPSNTVTVIFEELQAANELTFQYHSQLLLKYYERFSNAKELKKKLIDKIQLFKGLN